jgi:hypothetical protein
LAIAGISSAIRTLMMLMTTSNSIKVKALRSTRCFRIVVSISQARPTTNWSNLFDVFREDIHAAVAPTANGRAANNLVISARGAE